MKGFFPARRAGRLIKFHFPALCFKTRSSRTKILASRTLLNAVLPATTPMQMWRRVSFHTRCVTKFASSKNHPTLFWKHTNSTSCSIYSTQDTRLQWFHRFEKASTTNMTSLLGCQITLGQIFNMNQSPCQKNPSQIFILPPLWLCNRNEFCLTITLMFTMWIRYLRSIAVESGIPKLNSLHSKRGMLRKRGRSDLSKRGMLAPTTTQDESCSTIEHTRKWETTTRQMILNTFRCNRAKVAKICVTNKRNDWKKKYDPLEVKLKKERKAVKRALNTSLRKF